MVYYNDYDNQPIGGGNPYYQCSSCGVSDPQINGTLTGHSRSCKYRLKLEALGCTDKLDAREDLAHELWALAQLSPQEGIIDGVDRIKKRLGEE